MNSIKEFLVNNGYPEKVELLPYHKMGENKYSALGVKTNIFDVPSTETIEKLKSYISNF